MIWLLNWLWLGSLLTAAVAAGLAAARRLNAATRERVLWLTLAAVLALPCAALVQDGSASGVVGPVAVSAPASSVSTSPLIELPEALPAWTAAVWLFWLAWCAVVLVRLAHALLKVRRIRRNVFPFPAARERRLTRWTSLSGSHAAPQLVVSGAIHHAGVIGWGAPLIAISPAALATLTDDELDQVVMHEHAHVRRRDDLAVVAQRIAWALAGFHPAVWWLDRALTLEREVACDDWVLAHATAPKAYGACLVKLAAARSVVRWQLMPGAAMSRSELSQRVVRLLDPSRNTTVHRSPAALAVAAVAIGCGIVAGLQFPLAGQLTAPSVLELVAPPPSSRVEVSPVAPLVASGAETSNESTGIIGISPGRQISISRGVDPEAFVLTAPSPLEPTSTPSIPEDLVQLASLTTVPAVAVPRLDAAPVTTLDTAPVTTVEAPAANGRSPWMRMADAGVSIGDGARDAGVRAGGFFTRLGREAGRIW